MRNNPGERQYELNTMSQRTQLAKKEESCDCPKNSLCVQSSVQKEKIRGLHIDGKAMDAGNDFLKLCCFPLQGERRWKVGFVGGAINSRSGCLSFPGTFHTLPNHTPLWRSQCSRCCALLLWRWALAEVQRGVESQSVSSPPPYLVCPGKAELKAVFHFQSKQHMLS